MMKEDDQIGILYSEYERLFFKLNLDIRIFFNYIQYRLLPRNKSLKIQKFLLNFPITWINRK